MVRKFRSTEGEMPRIVHLAIKVENLDEATKFYEDVFGFKQTATERNGQHISRHMTDGYIDLALMIYDSENAPEAQLSGKGPCIHHFGIEVEDRQSYEEKIKAHGGQILSKPGTGALKFRSPDGTVAEIVAAGRYEEKKQKAAKADA
jgi:lactoylglutathione lyase